MYIPLKPLFSRHKGIGVQFTDEPTGALDSMTADEIMQIFERLNISGKTVIIVTHDKDIAARCKRVIELSDGEIAKGTN